jgi:hypothetical protein
MLHTKECSKAVLAYRTQSYVAVFGEVVSRRIGQGRGAEGGRIKEPSRQGTLNHKNNCDFCNSLNVSAGYREDLSRALYGFAAACEW